MKKINQGSRVKGVLRLTTTISNWAGRHGLAGKGTFEPR